MKKAVLKFTACCLAAGMTFAGTGTVALAATNNNGVLAGFRMSNTQVITAKEATAEETEAKETEAKEAEVKETEAKETEVKETEAAQVTESAPAEPSVAEETVEEVYTEAPVETEPVVDTSMAGEMAFAQCEEYINIRSGASVDSEVVGKVYNNCSVTILSKVGDWYEVQSGNAVGYVKADYFATGAQADAIAEEVAYNVATVYPEALTIRSEASTESDSIGMAYSSDELEVVAYEGDWMKVALGNDVYGYVNAYYVDYDTYYATAETLEEEQARLDAEWLEYLAEQEAEQERLNQEWLAYLAQQEAEQAAAEAAWLAAVSQQQSSSAGSQSSTSTQGSANAQAAADELYQAYLEAQAAADAATQQADEQLVYDTAAEAQQAYQEYLSAQNAADAAAQAAADAAAQQAAADAAAQQAAADAAAAQAAADAAAAQAAADAAAQAAAQQAAADAAAAQAAADAAAQAAQQQAQQEQSSSSSSSSLGQQLADYAVQFVGNPYVWGGTSLTNGADCSGFTQSVFRNFGISIPRTAASQSGSGTPVSLSDIRPGDLLFYYGGGSIGHVTMYIGNGQVVHASSPSTGIVISSYNYRTPASARRYW